MKILISAYACRPGLGSEPGIGWNCALEAARHDHEVWIITRANNRGPIEAELASNPVAGFHFVYYDLPAWARWWKRSGRGVQAYYYLWQAMIYFVGRRLHRAQKFDLVQHITFNRYWMPSFLSLLDAPFIWGPVGGGESSPKAFRRGMTGKGRVIEIIRDLARTIGERDPFVRLTARRCALALATTEESATRIRAIGARNIATCLAVALSGPDLSRLAKPGNRDDGEFRFVSIGRLLDWKGFDLGIRAFAAADLPGAEYWIVGDGPARASLERLVAALGIGDQTRFAGAISRDETLQRLASCHVMVHPSLHDSGGWACVEALAAGCPVICLDLGGPAAQVSDAVGFRVAAHSPDQAVRDVASAMRKLAGDKALFEAMSNAARRHAQDNFSWQSRGSTLNAYYQSVAEARHVV